VLATLALHPGEVVSVGQLVDVVWAGAAPPSALKTLQSHVSHLRQDLGDAAAIGTQSSPPRSTPQPGSFTGRDAELQSLEALLPAPADAAAAPVVIAAVSGTAGVGKTTLAVRWAHRVAARFPDGQLYVNLRGFDPGGLALEPSEAIRGFLEAFGVPVARIPADLDAQAGLYRSVLAWGVAIVALGGSRVVAAIIDRHNPIPACCKWCSALSYRSRSRVHAAIQQELPQIASPTRQADTRPAGGMVRSTSASSSGTSPRA
jgi:hypothetical protein